jgi:hypothetical protein
MRSVSRRTAAWAMEAVPDEASIYKIRREEKRI